jgi:predicted acylesterase/phospholipase RssA
MTLGDILKMEKTVLIPAFCLTTGYPRVFKPDHAPELSLHNGYRIADVAMASAAAPVYFPVHRITAPTSGVIEEFCDGGVFANNPAVLAYAEAISHLSKPSSEVEILSVSTPRTYVCKFELMRPWRRRAQLKRGFLRWRSTIASAFIDATSHINDQTLRRLADPRTGSGLRYERFLLPRPPRTGLDIATAAATQALAQVGSDAAQSGPARKRLEPFFT